MRVSQRSGKSEAASRDRRGILRGRISAVLRVAVGLGVLVLLTRAGALQWSALQSLVLEWRRSLLALGLCFLVILLVSRRLIVLLAAVGVRMRLAMALRMMLIGGFFSATLPGAAGGDVARMYLAARANPGQGTKISTIIVVDRFVGLLALFAFPLLMAVAVGPAVGMSGDLPLDGLLWAAAAGLLGGLAMGAACWYVPFARLLMPILRLLRLEGYAERLFDTLSAFRKRKKTLLKSFALSLAVQSVGVATLLLLVGMVGGSPATVEMALVIPLGMLANALPLTPGGLGVGEVAFAALFASIGAAGGAEAILAWRVLTTLLDLVGGGLLVLGRTDMSMVQDPP